jgi:hypothetical protein
LFNHLPAMIWWTSSPSAALTPIKQTFCRHKIFFFNINRTGNEHSEKVRKLYYPQSYTVRCATAQAQMAGVLLFATAPGGGKRSGNSEGFCAKFRQDATWDHHEKILLHVPSRALHLVSYLLLVRLASLSLSPEAQRWGGVG